MEDSLKKRYLIKLASNIINGLVNFILVAIVPKELGPIAYGQFIYLQQFFSQVIGLLDSGTSTAFFTKISTNTKRIELIKFYFIYSLAVLFFISGIIIFIDILNYLDFIFPDIPHNYIYMGILYGFLVWFMAVFIYIADAYVLTVSVELIKIAHKIFSLIFLLLMVYYIDLNLTNYFYFHYISFVIFILLVSYLFFKKNIFNINVFRITLNILTIIKEFIAYSSPLLVFNIFSIIFSLFDIWFLQRFAGTVQTGYYGLAYSIAAMCFLFTSAMTPIITREFAKTYAHKNFEQMKKIFYRYIPMLFSIASYFGIFIAFQSENLLIIFTDEPFHNAYLVLVIMAFYPIHQTYGQLSGSVFYVTEQTRLVKNIGIVSVFLGFILTVVLVYFLKLEAFGLALKMVLVQIFAVNIQLYFNSKFLNMNLRYFITHQIYSLIFFISIAYLVHLIVIDLNSALINFLISGFIYTVFVIIGAQFIPSIFGIKKEDLQKINIHILRKIKRG